MNLKDLPFDFIIDKQNQFHGTTPIDSHVLFGNLRTSEHGRFLDRFFKEGVKLFFLYIRPSATKRFARSRIFRYGCLMIILSNRQKEREGGGRTAPTPHGFRG